MSLALSLADVAVAGLGVVRGSRVVRIVAATVAAGCLFHKVPLPVAPVVCAR